jgi:UDPglucose 6-dehydrogenase
MRDAPSRTLMEALWEAGASVRAFDPEAMTEARRHYGERLDLSLASGHLEAAAGADALVVCTEWKQFRIVDFAWLKANLKSPVIVDGRNLYDPEDVRRHGLLYYAVGRGDSVLRNGAMSQSQPRRAVA